MFRGCETHTSLAARAFLDAIDDALHRHGARTNFAPGDAEWTETFGDDG